MESRTSLIERLAQVMGGRLQKRHSLVTVRTAKGCDTAVQVLFKSRNKAKNHV